MIAKKKNYFVSIVFERFCYRTAYFSAEIFEEKVYEENERSGIVCETEEKLPSKLYE